MKNTIKSHKNFNFEGMPRIAEPAFFMKYRPKLFKVGKFGLISSKKIFKTSVKRNRAKRLLKAWIKEVELPSKFDFLFIARSEILETYKDSGLEQLKKALTKIK